MLVLPGPPLVCELNCCSPTVIAISIGVRDDEIQSIALYVLALLVW